MRVTVTVSACGVRFKDGVDHACMHACKRMKSAWPRTLYRRRSGFRRPWTVAAPQPNRGNTQPNQEWATLENKLLSGQLPGPRHKALTLPINKRHAELHME